MMREPTSVSSTLDAFTRENPDLVEAMRLAGEAQTAWQAFEESREPHIEYSVAEGTREAEAA